MKKQVKYTAQLGFSANDLLNSGMTTQVIEKILALEVSKICGGCSTNINKGWWCEDGASHSDTFNINQLGQEITIELQVSCEMHKEEQTREAIQNACVIVANQGLAIDWVHLSRNVFNGLHFSVKNLKNSFDTTGGTVQNEMGVNTTQQGVVC